MTIPFVISVISLSICVFSFFFFRWYIARKTAARELLADYRAEVYRLIAEIDAATDRDSLLVEERIKTLKNILDDTDRRISLYMRELQRSRDAQAMYNSLGRGIRAALDSRPPQLELALNDTPSVQETRPQQEANIPREPPPPKNEEPAAKKRKPKKTKLKVQVAQMSAKGLSPSEIASRLHLSLAEVDLALNLLHRPTGN